MTPSPLFMFLLLMITIFLGVPVGFAMMGTALVFGWLYLGPQISYLIASKIEGVSSDFVLAAVPLFVFMGSVLEKAGIAERLFEALYLWTERLRGGLAISTVLMCTLFAASTGVVGATEVVVGLLAIPVMLKYRYKHPLMCGCICAGGSLGTIIPPSIVVVILGPLANVSVGDLLVGMIGPGLLMAALFVGLIIAWCFFDKEAGPIPQVRSGLTVVEKIRATMFALVPPLIMITAVLGSIMAGWAAPTEAAAIGALGALILSAASKTLSPKMLIDSLLKTVRITAMVMLVLLGGNIFTGVFLAGGGMGVIQEVLQGANFGATETLWLFLGLAFLGGFFLDWISVTLILVPIFLPTLGSMGHNPIWVCMLLLVIIQTSYLTPPLAPAIFYLKGITPPEVRMSSMFRGVVPFILVEVVCLLIVYFFPPLTLWLPEKLLGF